MLNIQDDSVDIVLCGNQIEFANLIKSVSHRGRKIKPDTYLMSRFRDCPQLKFS